MSKRNLNARDGRLARREFLAKGSATAALGMVGVHLPTLAAMARLDSADTVYRNAQIYTVDPFKPWAEAVAVREGRLLFVGSNDALAPLIGKKTKVVDLDGAFVVPGFHDVSCCPDRIEPATSAESFGLPLSKALDNLRAWGVTAISDTADLGPGHLRYHALEERGELKMKVQLAVAMNRTPGSFGGDCDVHAEAKAIGLGHGRSRLVDARNVEWRADGASNGRTSITSRPDRDRPKAKEGGNLTNKDIALARAFDRMGYRLHFRTANAGTTRRALDVLALLRRENPKNSVRHRISHAAQIIPNDAKRFKELGLGSAVSPAVDYSDRREEVLGHEIDARRTCSIERLEELGVPIAYGSGLGPSGRDANVMRAIEALVIRKDPATDRRTHSWCGPTVSLRTALRMVTINGAYVMQQEETRGSLEVGKFADMVVLSENLFDLLEADRPDEIHKVKVLKTIFEGETTYEAT